MMKVVEETSGIGELTMDGVTLCQVTYRLQPLPGRDGMLWSADSRPSSN